MFKTGGICYVGPMERKNPFLRHQPPSPAPSLAARLFPPVSARRQFFSNLARLLDSGVTIADGASTLEATGHGQIRQLARAARIGCERGQLLSQSLAAEAGLLTELQVGLIEAGERTGHLARTLKELASLEQETIEQFRKLLANLAYPLVVLVLSCLLLPLPKLVLGSVGGYVGAVVLRLLVLVAAVAAAWLTFRLGSLALERLAGRMPATMETALFPARRAYFFLVLRISLDSGLSIREGLALASRVWVSEAARKLTQAAIARLDAGDSLADALAPLVAPGLRLLLATGERSGKLEEAFAELHTEYSTRAAARRRLAFVVVSVLLAVAILGSMAVELASSFQQRLEDPLKELDREMGRELKGILNQHIY
jgi:general secretion pathway protein F